MAKILIVYYSKGGTTRNVAHRLARESNADLLVIRDMNERKGVMGYLCSVLEAVLHIAGRIRVHPVRGGTDLVVIGTPIWAWNMSSPVRAYISERHGEFKRVAFFCTYGSSGSSKVLRDLETLSGVHPVATLAVREDEVKSGKVGYKISNFSTQLKVQDKIPNSLLGSRAFAERRVGPFLRQMRWCYRA